MSETQVTRADARDAGCWIDGHWGQYAVARMVEIAATHGYSDEEVISLASRKLAHMGPNMGRTDIAELSETEEEILSDAADEVESWMNANVAPEGYYFGWEDGEFFLRANDPDFWSLCENAPVYAEGVASLAHWSTNYDAGRDPFSLFLDLIGFSADEIGTALYTSADHGDYGLGYLEAGKLAAALTEWADRPGDVRDFAALLFSAER